MCFRLLAYFYEYVSVFAEINLLLISVAQIVFVVLSLQSEILQVYENMIRFLHIKFNFLILC